MEEYHRPVLLRETVEALDIQDGGWYLDCTLGDGGHTLEILKRGGKVLGIDVDPQAIERAKGRLGKLGLLGKVKLVQGNFRDLKNLISQTEPKGLRFKGVLFDLGVSSLQLENPARGFSFAKEGPLDMRMDPELQVKALDLVNGLNKGELDELFTRLGEEKNSRALADALVSARQVRLISSTRQLAEVVEKVVGGKRGLPAGLRLRGRSDSRSRQGKIHPATRIFQALRIAVNDELNALREGLAKALEVTVESGHILVISFHSLEDRIVKEAFRRWQAEGLGRVVTKKPITPDAVEISENPRSHSAKLRVFEVERYDNYQKIRPRTI